jgi:translation initiation factor IF-1
MEDRPLVVTRGIYFSNNKIQMKAAYIGALSLSLSCANEGKRAARTPGRGMRREGWIVYWI